MPKTLRLSALQASVFTVIQMEASIGLDELAEVTGLPRAIIKSSCLILIARGLIEKSSKSGRMVYSVR
jgi:predicted transcriptional regulator